MQIGSLLNNRYTLIERLGKGAMGNVYRASDAETGQEVALKFIARDMAFDSDMLQRFRREGEALRQLRHSNIVRFIEMFVHEGQNVIVMEYVAGGNLHDMIRQGPLPIDRARLFALELADALARAHHIGIIHRDVKPENVLLTADGNPQLTDFGVARLVSEITRLTETGTQVGTPFYMSPEAWEGSPLDGQADIWSLGVVFYEMLAGKLPFHGDTVVAVMNHVLNAPLPDLCSLRPDVPPGLARIIDRMLCRDRAERYQTMREVAADIERGDVAASALRHPAASHPAAGQAPAAGHIQASLAATHPAAPPLRGRWRRLGATLARLSITVLIGVAATSCVFAAAAAVLLSNILEGVVTGIPFLPDDIGPGATYSFSRDYAESRVNRQIEVTLPGAVRDLRLTFIPNDTVRVDAKVFGTDSAFTFRTAVTNALPRVSLVRYNDIPTPLLGDILVSGVNRGFAKVFSQRKLEMISILFSPEDLTVVINGPRIQTPSTANCVSNQSFSDDFGAVHGPWNLVEPAEAEATFQDGHFVLRTLAPQSVLIQYLSGCLFGDAQITVEAVHPNPSDYIEYGLIFNRKDDQNYRALLISSTGLYTFDQVADGSHVLWPAGWTPTPLIHTDGQANQLGLRVEGTFATPSVNGQALARYDLGAATWGNVGLLIRSGDSTRAEVDFDNFAVAMLDEATPFPVYLPPPTATPEPTAVPAFSPVQRALSLGWADETVAR